MSITSNIFILFVIGALTLYYIAPEKTRWLILLIASYGFYLYASPKAVVFLAASTMITYLSGRMIGKIYSSDCDLGARKSKAKKILIAGMLLNLGILAVLKYTNFIIGIIGGIAGKNITPVSFVLPMGISYYTFQSLGYILDVYWERTEAEKNFGKYALFVSFFPQMLQGPIGRYNKLANQLYEAHSFSFHNIKFGLERILWGFFKKLVLADWAAVYCDVIFDNPHKYAGAAIFGTLLYTIELYGNFAGGVDVMLGVASMFGIKMDENFERPFFAVSLSDFWRRWHITLGSFMKDYVFYPLNLSKGMKKLGKHSKKVLGKSLGRNIPIAVSNLVVFFLVGIWHGPTWSNIGWGLYNGIIIAVSGMLAPVYVSVKKKLHINDKSFWYRCFMILRTFILINISWYFECVTSLKDALFMIKNSIININPSVLLTISSGKLGTAFTPYALIILAVGVLILFVVGVIQERGVRVRNALSRLPLSLQFGIFLLLLICVGLLSPMAAARGFIYAQF